MTHSIRHTIGIFLHRCFSVALKNLWRRSVRHGCHLCHAPSGSVIVTNTDFPITRQLISSVSCSRRNRDVSEKQLIFPRLPPGLSSYSFSCDVSFVCPPWIVIHQVRDSGLIGPNRRGRLGFGFRAASMDQRGIGSAGRPAARHRIRASAISGYRPAEDVHLRGDTIDCVIDRERGTRHHPPPRDVTRGVGDERGLRRRVHNGDMTGGVP